MDIKLTNLFLGTPADNMRDKIRKNRHAHGETHPQAKLTNEKVRWIRRLRLNGESYTAIAEEIGVNRSLVSKVLSGRKWAHVA